MIRFFPMSWIFGFLAAAAGLGALVWIPKLLLRRGQDRLAAEIVAGPEKSAFRLLTPAGRLLGGFRRLPGVLGLRSEDIVFRSRYEAERVLALSAVRRVTTGKVLSTGRRLLRAEALAIVDSHGGIHEFQMSHASIEHWRRHLGAWAARQKAAEAVSPERRDPPPAAR
jgi:hypothetical protein